ncbi:ScbR family autoregulator-binding transcription factor [Streptomyces sp.]|uniref:ScbR family autoregulator-binding transcription factor n=1 Tax=Streptomyces sp. TaxID=1931 RepID=UPI002F3F88A3
MQERAIRTRNAILSAAAKVFEERGFQAATIAEILAAARVTKGALYFHFQSKEDLAEGVLREQDEQLVVPERPCKVQQLVDVVMLHAYRLQTDCMVRAGVRLTMDQHASGIDRSGPFLRWTDTCSHLLEKAQEQGETLPHVAPAETAGVLVGSFAGVQAMSQAISDYGDLMTRVVELLRHVLPSVVQSAVLTSVDLAETRGAKVFAEARSLRGEREAVTDTPRS